jgi:hypothetical protein
LRCDFAPKAIRKAFNAITEHGADGVSALVQGKLARGDVIAEAGLVVQPREKPTAMEKV